MGDPGDQYWGSDVIFSRCQPALHLDMVHGARFACRTFSSGVNAEIAVWVGEHYLSWSSLVSSRTWNWHGQGIPNRTLALHLLPQSESESVAHESMRRICM